MAAPASVLFVCTGNVCRSPAAELLLRDLLLRRGADDVAVSSAGTHALVGAGVAGPTATLLRQLGVDASGFRARQLRPQDVGAADLVVTMTREQRAAVVRAEPRAVRRTFTLLELATLVQADVEPGSRGGPARGPAPTTGWAQLPAVATANRGLCLGRLDDVDVTDPYRRPERVHRQVLATVAAAVETVARAVPPAGSR
ncbi:low molecular weight phosphatase family protein [Xylanimonas oleitrophica]|uniref:protein-tyrosine-phosphatase n=1 Tax=Xylanimonas oleitrophica TaxID=2607479 RepID=A0A2W5WTR4_9MICO|nr:low molecular weight phosphatase family protein [Xylanimonas oleitrophica]PZR54262.1 low molecular weight phosphatase family protein [Xylanimonas oleitrophica]